MTGRIALVGGNEFRPDCEPMDRALLAAMDKKPKTVIIPAAAAQENPGRAAENGVRYFQRLGAEAEAVMVVDAETARQPDLAARVENADLVYFTGGDAVYLLETMRGSLTWKAVLKAWKRNRAIAGSSAGAMVLGGQMWAPGDGWRQGLGLVPHIAVIPHHARLAPRWKAARLGASLPEGVILVGIDEATALAGPPWQVLGTGEVTVYRGDRPFIFQTGQSVPLTL
jgi:cyanophycinase